MEENERLSKHSSQLTLDNHLLRQELQQMPAIPGKRKLPDQAALASTDTSCDSVVTGGLPPQPTPQHSPRASSPAELLSIAEETVTEFVSKATGTAIDWIQLPGMKPGPDAIGIVAISHGCPGVAARACSLVGLEPSKVVEVLKDRPSWLPDCRRLSILGSFPTANGGTVELLYTQVS
jgi:homeobox-leucine zipper protein